MRDWVAWLRARPRAGAGLLLVLVLFLTSAAILIRSPVDRALTAVVRKGDLVVSLAATGMLKPAQAISYRSPLAGREAEITWLVPEGTLVNEGDILVRIDTTEIQRELERAVQDSRQALVDSQVADVERQEGVATIDALTKGEGALGVEEARSALKRAEKKASRLREDYEGLKPLFDKGFITREELERAGFELEQAEADLELARRKSDVYIDRTHPRERQRAQLQLAQKQSQADNARARAREAGARVKALRQAIEECSIYARAPGLVVHDEFLQASPRRKVRVGDRVTGSQGIVTIPEVKRMLVEASVPEADVHRLHPGQPAVIRLDAFPELRLTGKVARVGTLARSSAERPWEEKRFDLILEVDPSGADLRPEMTARADVLVGERKGVLLLPINAVFDRQGVTVVHVVRALRVETRPVELADSSDLFVEVRAGLREGERVSLTDAVPAGAAAPAAGERGVKPAFRGAESGGAPLVPH
jgi:multidrug resistance efflux pump